MDPLTAVGVAASIAQFVNLGIQVAARLKEYNSATTDVPKALQHISAQLPLLIRSLERLRTEIEVEKVDLDTRCILKGVVSGCMQQVEKVNRIIEKVLHVPGDSLMNKVQKVFVGLKNDEKILAVEKNLQTYISVLILHRVIQGPDASLAVSEDSSYFEVRLRRVSPFSERIELMQDLEAHLFPAATSQVQNPIVVELVGPEGAGKTQLALGYCHQAKEVGQFQTIFWLNAASPENLCRSLESMADIIRQSKEGFKDRKEKIDFVKSFLANRWHAWLLVLDNYDHAAFKDVMDYLPSAGAGALLFISRHGYLPDAEHVVHVPTFRDADEIERLRSILVCAVSDNNIERVESLLDKGADPNSVEFSGWLCLNRAVEQENEALVKLLLAKGANSRLHSQAEGDSTALYWAASSGNTSITKLLLDHEDAAGLTPQAPGNNAILRYAARKGREKTVRMLIEHGSVQVSGQGEEKDTALGLAAKYGHTAVVKLLLDYGADAEVGCNGKTPLLVATNETYVAIFEIVKALCTQGKANVNTGFLDGYSALTLAIKNKSWGSGRPRNEMVKYLLERGADPNRYDESRNGMRPLQMAGRLGFENIVSMLLAHGADPFLSKYPGDSPVEEAADCGYESVVNLLVQAQAKDSSIRTKQLEQAIILASIKGHRDVILVLLEAGVNINSIGYLGKTPLLFAIEKQQIPTTRLLVRRGARQDLADDDGTLPLFLAAEMGLDAVVAELVRCDKNQNLDVLNRKGETPLCLAATKGHKKVCEVLRDSRASQNFPNKYGDTPWDLAVEKGHKEIIEVLGSSAWKSFV